MRKLIFILFLCPLFSFGQYPITTLDTSGFMPISTGLLVLYPDNAKVENSYLRDTVKITLLVTDCNQCNSKAMDALVVRDSYMERIQVDCGCGFCAAYCTELKRFYTTVKYLTKDKKELPESITIWQVK